LFELTANHPPNAQMDRLAQQVSPTEVVCDRGTEFKGELSRMIRDDYNIKRS
jgi:hypothetical protein